MQNSVNVIIDKLNIVGKELKICTLDFDSWSSIIDNNEYKQNQFGSFTISFLDKVNYWQTEVAHAKHIVLGIYYKTENRLCGILDFYDIKNNSCYTGISIFPSTNHGKGYATKAYNLAIPILQKRKKINNICVLVHPNQPKVKQLYKKLGFKFVSTIIDDTWDWEKFCLSTENL